MSTPKRILGRDRTMEAAERLAVRLYSMASGQHRQAEDTNGLNDPDLKAWWTVKTAAAEAVDVLRQARGMPYLAPVAPPFPGDVKTEELDHMGVPPKPAEKN